MTTKPTYVHFFCFLVFRPLDVNLPTTHFLGLTKTRNFWWVNHMLSYAVIHKHKQMMSDTKILFFKKGHRSILIKITLLESAQRQLSNGDAISFEHEVTFRRTVFGQVELLENARRYRTSGVKRVLKNSGPEKGLTNLVVGRSAPPPKKNRTLSVSLPFIVSYISFYLVKCKLFRSFMTKTQEFTCFITKLDSKTVP